MSGRSSRFTLYWCEKGEESIYLTGESMRTLWKGRPFAMKKMEQLWRLVRESHEQPMTGVARAVELVDDDQLGVTFIGHSSFLLQVDGRKVLVDPVFSKRLIVLRRQRQPGLRVEELPPIDLILLTHAHMDHLDMASLRRVIRATRKLTGNGVLGSMHERSSWISVTQACPNNLCHPRGSPQRSASN